MAGLVRNRPVTAPVRGQCAVCHYRFRLRKDGTLQSHHLFSGSERNAEPCAGSGQAPRPFDPNECADCMAYYYGTPLLAEAIWSVAIESPKPGEQLAWEFLESYHRRGHGEAA